MLISTGCLLSYCKSYDDAGLKKFFTFSLILLPIEAIDESDATEGASDA